jgi:hypothetical protein
MKRTDSNQHVDRSSLDAVKYRAAREVMAKVENQLAEEAEAERDERPGRTLVRFLAGVLLLAWIIVMSWIAVNAIKKMDPQAMAPNMFHAVSVFDPCTTAYPIWGLCR